MRSEGARDRAFPACRGPVDGNDDASPPMFVGWGTVLQAARFDSALCLWQGARRSRLAPLSGLRATA